MSDKILKIVSRYIYDSRGNPTVEVDVWTSKGRERRRRLLRNDPVSLPPPTLPPMTTHECHPHSTARDREVTERVRRGRMVCLQRIEY